MPVRTSRGQLVIVALKIAARISSLRRTTTTIPPEVSVVARCRARKPRSITLTTSHATTLVRAARTAALDSQRVRGN